MKRTLSIVLSLLMVLSCCAAFLGLVASADGGKYPIKTFAGYAGSDVSIVVRQEGKTTIGDVTGKDYNYYKVILVDDNNAVTEVLETLGRADVPHSEGDGRKDLVEIPEGGFAIGIHNDAIVAEGSVYADLFGEGGVAAGDYIKLYGVDLAALATAEAKAELAGASFDLIKGAVQPAELVALPEGAYTLDYAGYKHAAAFSILAGDGQTVAELTARGNNGTAKDLNYAYNILVDAEGEVIKTDFTLAKACDFVCPEGGYIISYNGNKAGYGELANVCLGDVITLYNVNIAAVGMLTGTVELTQAGFTVTPHAHSYKEVEDKGFIFQECEYCGHREGDVTGLKGEVPEDISVSHVNAYSWGVFDSIIFSTAGKTVKELCGQTCQWWIVYKIELVDGKWVATEFHKNDAENANLVVPEGGFLWATFSDYPSYALADNENLLGWYFYPTWDISAGLAIDTQQHPEDVRHMLAYKPLPDEVSFFEGEDWQGDWITAVPGENAGWQNANSTPAEGATEVLSYDYKYFLKDNKIYIGVKANLPLTKGAGNGASSFMRVWFKTADDQTSYSYFYEVYVKADDTLGFRAADNVAGATTGQNTPTNNEASAYEYNMQSFGGGVEAYIIVPLDEIGAEDYLRMFVTYSIEKATGGAAGNQCLYSPALAMGEAGPLHIVKGTWTDEVGNYGIKVLEPAPSFFEGEDWQGEWIDAVIGENAGWQNNNSAPAEGATEVLTLKYNYFIKDNKIYIGAKANLPLTKGTGNGNSSFLRVWFKTADDQTSYRYFYEVYVKEDDTLGFRAADNASGATIGKNTPVNNTESAYEYNMQSFDGGVEAYIIVPLDEIGVTDYLRMFVTYSIERATGGAVNNQCIYSPALAMGENGPLHIVGGTWTDEVGNYGIVVLEPKEPELEKVFDLGELKPINGITFTPDVAEGLANVFISISSDGVDFYDVNNGGAVAISGGKATPNISSRGVFLARYVKIVGEADVNGTVEIVEGNPDVAVKPEGPYTNTGINESGYGIVVIYEGTVDTNQGKGTELNIAGAQLVIANKVAEGVYKIIANSVNAWPAGGHADITSDIEGITIADGVITLAEDQIAVVIMSSGGYATEGDGEYSNCKQMVRGLKTNGFIRIDGAELTLHVTQPEEVVIPASGKYPIKTFAGYAANDVSILVRQEGKTTIGEVTGKDYNYYRVILVGADGFVTEVLETLGRAEVPHSEGDGRKDLVEIPEGGFAIGIHNDAVAEGSVYADLFGEGGVKPGDEIVLYGIDLEAAAASGVAGSDLANVSFDVVKYEEVPEEAVPLATALGWGSNLSAILVRLESGEKTIGEIRAVTGESNYTWWSGIVVDADGKVVKILSNGADKDAEEIPEGGYVLVGHGTSAAKAALDIAKVNDTVTLYNVDLAAIAKLDKGIALKKAAFIIGADPNKEYPLSYEKSYVDEGTRHGSYNDAGLTKMTDGIYTDQGGVAETVGGWSGIASITIDLEDVYFVDTFKAHAFGGQWGITLIDGFKVAVSEDGETFTELDAQSVKGEVVGNWQSTWFTIELDHSVSARYVKFTNIGGNYFWLDELEVWEGEPYVEPYVKDVIVKEHEILTDAKTGFTGAWGTVGQNDVLLVANAECKNAPMLVNVIYELDEAAPVSGVVIDLYHDANVMIGYPEGKAAVYASLDGEEYALVGEFELLDSGIALGAHGTVSNAFTFDEVEAKFIKIVLNAGTSTEVLGENPADGKVFWEFISIAEVVLEINTPVPFEPVDIPVSHLNLYNWSTFEVMLVTLENVTKVPNAANGLDESIYSCYVVDFVNGKYIVSEYVTGNEINSVSPSEGGFLLFVHTANAAYDAIKDGVLVGKQLVLEDFDLSSNFAIDTQRDPSAAHHITAQEQAEVEYPSGCWEGDNEVEDQTLFGDLNDDGEIGLVDYAKVKRQVLGTYTLTDTEFYLADVDNDGDVTIKDYAMIKRQVLGTYEIPKRVYKYHSVLVLLADGTGTYTETIEGYDVEFVANLVFAGIDEVGYIYNSIDEHGNVISDGYVIFNEDGTVTLPAADGPDFVLSPVLPQ